MSGGIVLLAGDGESTNILYNALSADFDIAGAIIEKPVPRTEFLKRRAKKHGWASAVGQAFFRAAAVPLLEREAASRLRDIRKQFALDTSPIPPEKRFDVGSVNSEDTRKKLRELSPAVVVINGTRIISGETIECVAAPFLNMHAGITPLYRGVHGGYWALVENRPDACGVTVHLVDTGIDTGGVLYQALIAPEKSDNFAVYPLLQIAAGLPLMKQAVRDALNGRLKPGPGAHGESRLWMHPTLGEYLRHRITRGVR